MSVQVAVVQSAGLGRNSLNLVSECDWAMVADTRAGERVLVDSRGAVAAVAEQAEVRWPRAQHRTSQAEDREEECHLDTLRATASMEV